MDAQPKFDKEIITHECVSSLICILHLYFPQLDLLPYNFYH